MVTSQVPCPYQRLIDLRLCDIVAIEAHADECEVIRELLSGQVPVVTVPVVVGDGGPATFHICRVKSTSSTFPPNISFCREFDGYGEHLEVVSSRRVQTTRLDDVEEIGDIDYLKSDIQGGEVAALQGGTRVLSGVAVAELEVEFAPQYDGGPLFADVDSAMRELGFMFHTFTGYGSRPLKSLLGQRTTLPFALQQWLWANAVYLRPFSSWSTLAPVKIVRLAAILHEVYSSFDFAYRALCEFDQLTGSQTAPAYRRFVLDTSQ
jgi:FkbM family methyltransferase